MKVVRMSNRGSSNALRVVVSSALVMVGAIACGERDEPLQGALQVAELGTIDEELVVALDVRVVGSSNDGEESSTGSMSLTSTDLELVTDGSRGAQRVGMRFQNIAVPKAAQITTARLVFTVDEVTSAATSVTIRGQRIDDAPTFTTSSNNISSRTLTTASVSWSPGAWSTVGQTQQSPDVSAIVQEIVNRNGWASGNDMVFVIQGSGSRVAEAYDGVAASAPLLHIEYDNGASSKQPTQENLLIAFIGDQGANNNSTAVLQLIKNEGAAAVVHNGDFDYADNPTSWDNRINGVLGATYPYFSIIGNHDAAAWSTTNGYAAKIQQRHASNPEMSCSGELGVRANCNFRGLHLIESCIGTKELRSSCGANSADQVSFIRDSLATSNALFKVCSWHKNQHEMQVGSKSNEVGWDAYRECVAAGAIISTGHEHSYSRTLTLTNVGHSASGHGATGAFDVLNLAPQSSFVFVSGLAGVGLRAFQTSHNADTWWASYYTSDRWYRNGTMQSGVGNYGALFIRFYVDGNPNKAYAYFKDVSGRIVDSFTIFAQ